MGSGKKKKARVYQLHCKWHECDTPCYTISIDDYGMYGNHLRMHIDSSINVATAVFARVENQEEGSQLVFTCEWQGCNIELFTDPMQFTRHVMYHGYHSKLKETGRQEQELSKFAPCQLNDETKDYLPDLSDPFICFWENCGSEFQCPLDFFSHVDAHALRTEISVVDDPEEYFNCYMCKWNECNCTFKTVYKLKEHCRVHTHEKLIACPVCGGFFANRTKFIDHLSRQDSESYENFQCSHCLRRCASERLLRDHMRHHVNHLKCPQCDMTCPNPSSLRDHFRFRHCQDRPYACESCSFKCKSSSDLQRHEETHLGNQYQCPVQGCTFKTKTLAYLKSHHKNKHENAIAKKFVCHICEARYSRGTGLTTHLKDKHNFRWPSGHPRFRYKEYEDGLYRLQMVRFESAELTEKLSENEGLDEEIVELADQEEDEENASMIPQHNVIYTEAYPDDHTNFSVVKNIQDTISQAQLILGGPIGDQSISGSSALYVPTISTVGNSVDASLSLQLIQIAAGQGTPGIQISEELNAGNTSENMEFPTPVIPPSKIDIIPSGDDLERVEAVPSTINSTQAEELQLQERQGEAKGVKRKKVSKKTRKKKRTEEPAISIASSTVTSSQEEIQDHNDYDQRLDISHTLLSLHSTGLIRL